AALGSGALITADAALAMDRTVMAVPGSVFSALSVGCHQLLRDGAGLVQNARDVLAELSGPAAVLDDPLRPPDRLGIEPAGSGGRDGLLVHLSDTLPVEPGDLARRLGLAFSDVVARLTRLELDGAVRRTGGGYLRVHGRGMRSAARG